MPKAANLRHIIFHNPVAALRHHRGFFKAPDRREAQSQKTNTKRIGDLADFAQMPANLVTGLVDMFQRRARKLELAARLQRYARPVTFQADNMFAFIQAFPAKLVFQPIQKRLDAALIRDRTKTFLTEAELLVLGADQPLLFWLTPLSDPIDKFSLAFNARGVFVNIVSRRGHTGTLLHQRSIGK